jgi:hypothetical protein
VCVDPFGTVAAQTQVILETDPVIEPYLNMIIGYHSAVIITCGDRPAMRYELGGERYDLPNNHNNMKITHEVSPETIEGFRYVNVVFKLSKWSTSNF